MRKIFILFMMSIILNGFHPAISQAHDGNIVSSGKNKYCHTEEKGIISPKKATYHCHNNRDDNIECRFDTPTFLINGLIAIGFLGVIGAIGTAIAAPIIPKICKVENEKADRYKYNSQNQSQDNDDKTEPEVSVEKEETQQDNDDKAEPKVSVEKEETQQDNDDKAEPKAPAAKQNEGKILIDCSAGSVFANTSVCR